MRTQGKVWMYGIVAAALAGLFSAAVVIGEAGHEHGKTPGTATATATAPSPQFVNARCPIMGTVIDPSKVTPGLVREYKGQKVAFCCGGCPPAWDKLTDAEKDAKLAKASGEKSK